MGKACPFSSPAIQNLTIIAIFKLMALRDTLVYESVHLLILVCSFQWCVLFLCLAKLYRSCPIRDKGILTSFRVIGLANGVPKYRTDSKRQ